MPASMRCTQNHLAQAIIEELFPAQTYQSGNLWIFVNIIKPWAALGEPRVMVHDVSLSVSGYRGGAYSQFGKLKIRGNLELELKSAEGIKKNRYEVVKHTFEFADPDCLQKVEKLIQEGSRLAYDALLTAYRRPY